MVTRLFFSTNFFWRRSKTAITRISTIRDLLGFSDYRHRLADFRHTPSPCCTSVVASYCEADSRSRVDHDPARPQPWPALGGHPLEPIGRGLASTDPGAPSLPGPLSPAATRPLPSHLGELQRPAVGLGRRSHDLGHEGPRIVSTAAAIAYVAKSRAKVEVIIVGQQTAQIAVTALGIPPGAVFDGIS